MPKPISHNVLPVSHVPPNSAQNPPIAVHGLRPLTAGFSAPVLRTARPNSPCNSPHWLICLCLPHPSVPSSHPSKRNVRPAVSHVPPNAHRPSPLAVRGVLMVAYMPRWQFGHRCLSVCSSLLALQALLPLLGTGQRNCLLLSVFYLPCHTNTKNGVRRWRHLASPRTLSPQYRIALRIDTTPLVLLLLPHGRGRR
mgnify:CR=1 FL=1